VWESALTTNGVRVISIHQLYSVQGKNENLYASVRVVIAVKVIPSEKLVTLVGCLSSFEFVD